MSTAMAWAKLLDEADDKVEMLVDALTEARDMCSRYADFIRQNVRADDLEMHPYLPDLEDVVTAASAALARARGESA